MNRSRSLMDYLFGALWALLIAAVFIACWFRAVDALRVIAVLVIGAAASEWIASL